MDALRKIVEVGYFLAKPLIFSLTRDDPEKAHNSFIRASLFLSKNGLDNLLLKFSNEHSGGVEISNAAGFNKNGDIPPSFLGNLGFDRVVVGTVTADCWKGNERPRMRRYSGTNSLVNWMGLPGEGVEKVSENLSSHRSHKIPLTINLMGTPGKKGNSILKDIEKTTMLLRNIPYVDRFELNISCPNTSSSGGKLDARREYQNELRDMLKVVRSSINQNQTLYVKLSPDLKQEDIVNTAQILSEERVDGVTISNTTTYPSSRLVPFYEKGGASGDAVYDSSLHVQKEFTKCLQSSGTDLKIIACGGINSPERLRERILYGADGIQIYTPLIFRGPRLLRKLKTES